MNFTKTEHPSTLEEVIKNLHIDDNVKIKGKNKYKYLGFIIPKKATTEEEIKQRLGKQEKQPDN